MIYKEKTTIKEIRLSERRQYQKITDVFEATNIDYNKDSEEAYTFFKISYMQNLQLIIFHVQGTIRFKANEKIYFKKEKIEIFKILPNFHISIFSKSR